MSDHDPYLVLGLRPGADADQVRRAYRRLARASHPDTNPGDPRAEERFKEISAAYAALTRATAPRMRTRWVERAIPVAGADRDQSVTITATDLLHGTGGQVRITRLVGCEACDGTGDRHMRPPRVCAGCDGHGVIRTGPDAGDICEECGGRGREIRAACAQCEGRGRIERTDRVRFEVPTEVADGDRLRLRGMGDEGVMGGRAGDLILTLHLAAADGVSLEGADLVLDHPVDVLDLVLGATLAVDVAGETVSIQVPPGTPADGQTYIPGHGRMGPDGMRGDLVVRIIPVTPDLSDDEELRELLSRVRALHREREG